MASLSDKHASWMGREISISQLSELIGGVDIGRQLVAQILQARSERDAARGEAERYRNMLLSMMPHLLDKDEALSDPDRQHALSPSMLRRAHDKVVGIVSR